MTNPLIDCRRALAVLAVCAAGMAAPALEFGDPAPALAVDHWVGGDAVDPSKPDGKTVYVVEFWFVDCPPCQDSAPILNRIQETMAGQGVVVVGVNIADDDERVRAFREKHGIQYRTAVDRPVDGPGHRQTTFAYHSPLPADGRLAYPSAFVVDAEGRVVWRGSPLAGLEQAVRRVVAGEWTVVQAQQLAAADAEMRRAQRDRDPARLYAAVKTLAALEPDNPQHYIRWFAIHQPAGHPDDLDAALDGWYRASAGSPDSFLALAEKANDSDDFARRRPRLAAGALYEASTLAAGDARAMLMVAVGYAKAGLFERAEARLADAIEAGAGTGLLALGAAQVYGMMGKPGAAAALLGRAAPPSEEGADTVFATHRAYYEGMEALRREPEVVYVPTAEAPAAPAVPALTLPEPMPSAVLPPPR